MKELSLTATQPKAQNGHPSDIATATVVFESDAIQRSHKGHFLTLIGCSFSALFVFGYQVLAARPTLYSEQPNCTVSYFFDLYMVVIAFLGTALVSLVNMQTRVCERGEPPVVLYGSRQAVFVLFAAELVYCAGAFAAQALLCSASAFPSSTALLTIKLVSFSVQFLLGLSYLRTVLAKAVRGADRGSQNPFDRDGAVKVTLDPRATKSEREASVSEVDDKMKTLHLENSDASTVSKFSTLNFDPPTAARSTLSADLERGLSQSQKGHKKRLNFMIK